MYSERAEVGLSISDTKDWVSRADNDSSADYWRVTKDKDGNITKIENTNSNNVTFVDEEGNQTGFAEYTGGSRTEFLGSQLGKSRAEANQMLINAGYTFNESTGLFEGANAKQAFDITGKVALAAGPTVPPSILAAGPPAQPSLFDRITSWAAGGIEQAGNWLAARGTEISRFFGVKEHGTMPETLPKPEIFDMYRDTTSSFGKGTLEEPFLRTGSGFFNQITQYDDLGFASNVGPCLAFAAMGPFRDAGFSQAQVIAALSAVGGGYFGPVGEVTGDINSLWQKVAQHLGSDKHPAYLGAGPGNWRPELDRASFMRTGATMGLLWIQNPDPRFPDRQHWLYVSKQNGSWNAYDPWNVAPRGLFDTWGIEHWNQIRNYRIRPLVWVEGGAR